MCVGAWVPEISHVIPLWVLQTLKSERWNSAVFRVLQGMVARELRAELMGPPRLLRLLGLSRLAGCLLGAGVSLDLFGGQGALRGAFAAVGALP